MRVVIFKIFVFFLLLGGGHYFYANPHQAGSPTPSTHSFKETPQRKFKTKDQSIILIDDTDLDVEEEYLRADDFKENSSHHFFVDKSNLSDKWYAALSPQFILNYYKNGKTKPPLSGNAAPIYIKNQVLRL